MKCEHCTDGRVYLFTSISECEYCNGTGVGEDCSIVLDKYEYGMGFQSAIYASKYPNYPHLYATSNVDFSIPGWPKKTRCIKNFITPKIDSELWEKTDEKWVYGQSDPTYERLAVLYFDADIEDIIFGFGYDALFQFQTNNIELIRILTEVESGKRTMTYKDIDKMLGAYS